VILAISWPASVVLLGVVLWEPLGKFDMITHAFRSGIGMLLGLDRLVGVENTHAAACVLIFGGLGLIGLASNVSYTLFGPPRIRRYQRY
jgi:hypothetical protein